jgi:hypothetical protein
MADDEFYYYSNKNTDWTKPIDSDRTTIESETIRVSELEMRIAKLEELLKNRSCKRKKK